MHMRPDICVPYANSLIVITFKHYGVVSNCVGHSWARVSLCSIFPLEPQPYMEAEAGVTGQICYDNRNETAILEGVLQAYFIVDYSSFHDMNLCGLTPIYLLLLL